MTSFDWKYQLPWLVRLLAGLALVTAVAVPALHAADNDEDIDSYKVRIYGFWFYSNPSGNCWHKCGEEGGTSFLTFPA